MEFWARRFADRKLEGSSRGRRGAKRRERRSLGWNLERLESRVVLSTWSGGNAATDVNWSDGLNWQEGTAPVAGADLIFPTGVSGTALTNTNDIAADTSFNSLSIQNNGYTITGNAVDLDTIDASQTTGSSSLGLPITLGTTAGSVTVDNAAATLVMGGVLSGSDGLTKLGPGVLDLTGANTYTGTTTVSAGTLHVDGPVGIVGPVAVSTDATLGGTGTVGSITTTGAIVSPGDSTTGVLTDNGALTLDSASAFDATINGATAGTDYSQLQVAGAINLANAALSVTLSPSYNPPASTPFTIINNTGTAPITGTFAGLAQGATVTVSGRQFTISYVGGTGGNSVVLTSVAVPTATWTGGDVATSDNWSDKNNWQEGTLPAAGFDVVFPAGLTTAEQQSNNDITGLSLTSILIQDTGYVIGGDTVTLSGGVDASQTSSGSTLNLPVTFSGTTGSVTVDNTAATLTMGGAITSTGGVTKSGTGTLALTGNSGTTGATVAAGTLHVDTGGTVGSVAADSGTTLGGEGTVAGIVTVGATLSPGDSATSTGTLTDTGNTVLDPNSTFAETINGAGAGSDYSQLQAAGTINLNGATLSTTLAANFTPTPDEKFTIIDNTGTSAIEGTFAGLAEGGVLSVSGTSFSITYKGGTAGNSVVLTALAATTTTISPVTTSPVFGQLVALTATITPTTTGTGTPTGTVEFEDGTTDLGSATVNTSGVATLDTTKLNTGSNSITAVYSGDTSFATSTSAAVVVTVAQATSTTTLTTSPNPSTSGQSVTLTATVAPVSPASGTPTGSVTFMNGTASLSSAVTLSNGVATFTTSALVTGSTSLTAVYSGDTNFGPSTSTAVTQVVNEGATSVSVSVSSTNPFGLQPVTLTALVAVISGTGTPTGTVTFFDASGTNLGSGTLNSNNTATLTVQSLPVGQESITANYSGDTNFIGATSLPVSLVVGSSTELFVNQVYEDVLNTASDVSADLWVALVNGGYPPKVVATYILQSQPAQVQAVQDAYQSLLGRPATAAELHRALAPGNARSPVLYADIFGSKEFYRTEGGGTDDGFLTALAKDWFGTPFRPATQAHLASELKHGTSRQQVAYNVITSPSGVRAEVNTIFEDVLGRDANAREQARFAPMVKNKQVISVFANLFASREFKTKFVDLT